MKKNSDYKQIIVNGGSSKDCLAGKVVERFAFSGGDSYDTSFFVLMFTDKTYIAIGIERDDDGDPYVTDFRVSDPNCVNFGEVDHWFDINGELHFDKWVDVLRNLGLWEVTEDEVAELVRKNEERARERDYAEYLRLKKKFEGE